MIDSPDVTSISERRAHPRVPIHSLTPINLGEGTTGTVLNMSEGGLAMRVSIILPDHSHSSYTILFAYFKQLVRDKWTDRVGERIKNRSRDKVH